MASTLLISDNILQQLTTKASSGAKLWVAFSGGMDSTALLHTLASSPLAQSLSALHVNHQLSIYASHWQQHCEDYCRSLGVRCYSVSVDLDPEHADNQGKGLEAAARDARYQVFNAHLKPGDVLLMGHHQNDQAETFLYRAMRGAGLKGLCGMPLQRELLPSQAILLRPILDKTRADIESYAQSHGLQWIEDESNTEQRFDRNFIRHRVLPRLLERWPQGLSALTRATENLRADQALLDTYLADDLHGSDCRNERLGQSIALSRFVDWPLARQCALIRYWVRRNAYLPPQQVHLQELAKQLQTHANSDGLAKLCIGWGGKHGCELRWFNQRLYLIPRLSEHAPRQGAWHVASPYDCGDGFILQLGSEPIDASANSSVDSSVVLTEDQYADRDSDKKGFSCFNIGLRQSGLRMQVRGRQRGQSVKKLLQEAKLEPWLRQRIPFIYAEDTLLAIGDIYLAKNPLADALVNVRWLYPENTAVGVPLLESRHFTSEIN